MDVGFLHLDLLWTGSGWIQEVAVILYYARSL